ncbi:MAG: translation initiation factor IF-2 [Candidatus Omnitrophica bacterium]|nr:translation initiation factor IF-2 [Candidatus Omnitrophota bacterium]
MLVRDLAKQYNITEELITATLKATKLRAKGEDQELSPGVLMVLKGELESKGLIPKQEPDKKAVKKPAVKKPVLQKPVAQKNTVEAVAQPARKKKEPEPVKEPVKEKPVFVTVRKLSEVPVRKPVEPPPPVVKIEPPAPVEVVKVEPLALKPVGHTETTEEHTVDEQGRKIIKRVTKTIVTVTKKKVAPAAPAFVAVQPLKKRLTREDRSASMDVRSPAEDASGQPTDAVAGAPAVAAKAEGPLKDVEIKLPVTVGDLAFKMQHKVNIVLKALMGMGVFANINQNLGEDIVRKLCQGFGFNLIEIKSQEEQLIADHTKEQEDPSLLQPRAPVVTFMGHVDHGKTSLLDAIRKTKVVDSEHGGITQHIRAYSVKVPRGTITFMDTPGHAAFTAMRSRGAHITDIVVLVVAANEGIMPQTEEAIDHARAAGVPIVVALNKIDLKDADPEMVKKQLMEHDLMPEEWGGKIVVCPVSAQTGQGLDNLLEMILLESEMLQLKANPDKKAAGIVVEAHMSTGKGPLATLIVQNGTLREGDIVVVGPFCSKVKAMFDDHKRQVKLAGPCMPVEILGLPGVPEAGEKFFVMENEKAAREIASVREEKMKTDRLKESSKITLEALFAKREAGEVRELNVIIKGDVQGSVGALRTALEKITSESKEVAVKFIHSGVGEVNPSDIILAHVSKAIIIAFNVGTSSTAADELEKTPVEVRRYNVIYDIVNDIRVALEGMLKPDTKRHFLARAEVRQVFNLTKSGIVAGCFMLKGRMRTKMNVDVMRNAVVVHTGKLITLKRFKDDVKEVGEGFECGIAVSGYDGYQPGDMIEAFEIENIARTL